MQINCGKKHALDMQVVCDSFAMHWLMQLHPYQLFNQLQGQNNILETSLNVGGVEYKCAHMYLIALIVG